MNIKQMSDEVFFERFKASVSAETNAIAEVVEYVREADARRLYLKFGCTSLFQFLTEHLGYAAASAQRRIEAARLLREVPELKQELKTGELNLTQISNLARAVREKEKTEKVSISQKREILCAIKKQSSRSTEKTIAQMLDMPVVTYETKRIQKDESVRREVTSTAEQEALFEEVKSIISHTLPNPSFIEVFEYLARRFVKGGKRKTTSAVEVKDRPASAAEMKSKPTFAAEMTKAITNASGVTSNKKSAISVESGVVPNRRTGTETKNPRYLPTKIKASVREDRHGCQWKHDGKLCGSKFQLQFDHIQPVWAGGTSAPDNIQILCGVHNRLRYRHQQNLVRRR